MKKLLHLISKRRPFSNSRVWVSAERNFSSQPHIFLLKLRGSGFFSNVNEVVQQIAIAKEKNYKFIIDWSSSCYRIPEFACDPWLYYFKPCFEIEADGVNWKPAMLPGGGEVACSQTNIITPSEINRLCGSMLLPRDRVKAHEIIKNHIKPHDDILNKISSFQKEKFRRHMIGLHIRGAGRIDKDIKEVRPDLALTKSVSIQTAFHHIDEIIEFCPNVGIFACSDSQIVINQIKETYEDRVVSYPSQRSDFGEMHVRSNENNKGLQFDNRKLGEEVLIEALLLSQTNFFIHSFSNISNFVLCANPTLFHRYVPISG